ncbi:MAG: efflux RND transporter permease subunit [Gemmatimonadetes bacterium]|nr:efflux RND transporter permease subunit [Gemmatimonadota bacterium]
MNFTSAAIRNDRVTLVALLVVLVAGISAYGGMPRSEDPGFVIRTALVLTYFPGASPARVEQLVTDKLEKTIQEIPQIDFISSQSKTGVSIIYVNIREDEPVMRPIWDDLRRKVQRAQGQLPDGVIGPFVNDEFGDVFGTILTVTGEGYSYAELKEIADDVRDEMLRLPDVAKVEIHGAQEERLFVEYNNARLSELDLSASQLTRILESRNIIIPGGAIDLGPERVALEPSGNFDSVEDLRRTVIHLPGTNELVYLEDLVSIERGYVDPPESKVRSTGVTALALAVSKKEGGNIITLGADVKALQRRLAALYPYGVDFDLVAYQPAVVDRKVKDFQSNLLQAVAIVLVVMLFSLGLRTGLVVASLIPAAIISSLFVMSLLGIGIDQMSLAALIIALGLLVDNAIVMAESIMVQMQEGKPAFQAAVDTAAELRVSLLTSSLTTAAAFLPIYLAESTTGEYTAPIFEVVTITLLCSWVLALTMTPLFCVKFLRVKPQAGGSGFDSRFYRSYRGALTACLRHPWVTMLGVFVLFFLAMQAFRFVPNIFFPSDDTPILSAEFELPVGSRIQRTDDVVRRFEEKLEEYRQGPEDDEGLLNWASFVGAGAPRYVLTYSPEQTAPEYAYLIINATSREYIDSIIPELEDFCLENFPDLKATIAPKALGPPITAPIEVRLSGTDLDVLFANVDQVKEMLREIPGTKDVRDNWGPRVKKLVVAVDEARALRAGLTNQDVAVSLQTMLSGLQSTEYREDDEVIPVVLRSVAADRQDIGKLEGMNIYSQTTGRNVPLKQVADVRLEWEPSTILRRDRLKTVTVSADVLRGVTPSEVTDVLVPRLDDAKTGWPFGYIYGMGGELEGSVKAANSIGAKLPIAGLIIVLLLVFQFNSLRRPLIILATIPLGLIGVIIGLIVAHSYFGFMTLLGLVSLAGIVINNAIVLIERIKIEEDAGLASPAAIVEAAQRRLRPIVLTTATTVGGLVPLWLGGGPMFAPMAIAILFGLLFATLLTLGVVPVLYAIFFRVSFRGYEAKT